MDFIERWFHVSPDGGNGSLEALYIACLVLGAMALVFRKPLRRRLGSWLRRPR